MSTSRLTKFVLISITALIGLISCSEAGNGRINLFVSIQPQKYFAEKIGGEKVNVSVFVKPGMSPENFEPLPAQLFKLSEAEIFFKIGMQFEEKILNNVSTSKGKLKIINTAENIKFREVESEEILNGTIHHFAESKSHSHLYDPHIWLSPNLVKEQSRVIYNSLSQADTVNKNYYLNNYQRFISEIDSASQAIRNNLVDLKNRNLLVFHPAWGYFCDEFELKQIPVEFEGKEPGLKQISKIMEFVKKEKIGFILAESQNLSPALTSISEELNLKVIYHDPLASDYLNNLILLSEVIKDNN